MKARYLATNRNENSSSNTNAENVAKLVFEAAGLAKGEWVGKERILEAEGRIVRSREYLELGLGFYLYRYQYHGNFFLI